jgi:hypothetical protein
VVGLGAQDDFSLAISFLEVTGVKTPTMIWDPSFTTWRSFGVRANSQMMVLAPDLETGSSLIYGFDEQQQADILEFAATGFGG